MVWFVSGDEGGGEACGAGLGGHPSHLQLTSRAEGVLDAPCMSPAKGAVSIGAGWLAQRRGHGGVPGVCRWEASAEASPLLVDSHRYFYKV